MLVKKLKLCAYARNLACFCFKFRNTLWKTMNGVPDQYIKMFHSLLVTGHYYVDEGTHYLSAVADNVRK
ncbi:hypothetical protein GGD38_002801 [Chitinophagaceae bacterium OAS944]|nr:hypothetical protein [Chitinophagaceae bacterium OAS944]